MERLLTPGQMREIDRYAVDSLGIPSLILMENAGRGTIDLIERRYGSVSGKKFVLLCGPGNNGGDGFVAARHIYLRGGAAVVIFLGGKARPKGDAGANFLILKNFVKAFKGDPRLKILIQPTLAQVKMLPEADFLIDGLFGTGFSGDLKKPVKALVEWINGRAGIKVALDIPSGLNSENGTAGNIAVKADLTATMGFKKIGTTINDGMIYAGSVEPVNISIPEWLPYKKGEAVFITDSGYVRSLLPVRPRAAHKHSVGKIIILAGSTGMTGAATLTSLGAMRAGAGTVILGAPKSAYPIISKKVTEVMVQPLPETGGGSLNLEAFNFLQEYHDWADLLIFGPGFSKNPETAKLTWKILSDWDKPAVADADALNHISVNMNFLKSHASKELIITPHQGEFLRLTGLTAREMELKKIEIVKKFSEKYRLTCVLKGAPTITVSDGGDLFINPTGNQGMATAGMGDLLSGLIGGLYAQRPGRNDAAVAAVFLHGLAGDIARRQYGILGLMASDVLESIPGAILQTQRDKSL